MNVATIGTGFIVEWFLDAVKDSEGIECIGIYSRKEESGRKLADAYGVEKVYTDLDEMLAVDDIDFIYVASPNSLHYEQSLKALQAGKNVICEKPFTSTLAQLDHLIETAKKRNLFLFEAIVNQHNPNYKTIKQQLDRIGQVRMVQCNYSQYSSRYDRYLEHEVTNVFSPEFSGGALSDINIYCLHFTIGLFGEPNDAHYYPNIGFNGIDTSGVAILEYDGFQAVCVGCKDTRSECISQIQGEKGYITVHAEPSNCAQFDLYIGKDKAEDLNTKQREITLYYELQDFKKIFEENDHDACDALLKHSRKVVSVYEKLRKGAGILFACDK